MHGQRQLLLYTIILLKCILYTDDDELDDILTSIPEGSDYSPFPSRMYALAYMLVHSPRPTMKNLTLKQCFVVMAGCFIYREKGI